MSRLDGTFSELVVIYFLQCHLFARAFRQLLAILDTGWINQGREKGFASLSTYHLVNKLCSCVCDCEYFAACIPESCLRYQPRCARPPSETPSPARRPTLSGVVENECSRKESDHGKAGSCSLCYRITYFTRQRAVVVEKQHVGLQ